LCKEDELLVCEQKYLDEMWDNGKTCFNVSPDALRNINGVKTFDIVLVDSNGNKHGPIVGLGAFARKHGMFKENLSTLIKGRLKSYKGWRLDDGLSKRPQSRKKGRSFISPSGKIHENVKNMTEFAERFKLHYSGFSKLARGRLRTYRGWRLA